MNQTLLPLLGGGSGVCPQASERSTRAVLGYCIPALLDNCFINPARLHGGSCALRRNERKSLTPAEELDFYRPRADFYQAAFVSVCIFEQTPTPVARVSLGWQPWRASAG